MKKRKKTCAIGIFENRDLRQKIFPQIKELKFEFKKRKANCLDIENLCRIAVLVFLFFFNY